LDAFRHLWPLQLGGGLAAPLFVRAPLEAGYESLARTTSVTPCRCSATSHASVCVARHTLSLSPPSPATIRVEHFLEQDFNLFLVVILGALSATAVKCEQRMTARGGKGPGTRATRAGSEWRAGACSLSLATEEAGIGDSGF
jgi:hypothetical protein